MLVTSTGNKFRNFKKNDISVNLYCRIDYLYHKYFQLNIVRGFTQKVEFPHFSGEIISTQFTRCSVIFDYLHSRAPIIRYALFTRPYSCPQNR